MLTSCLMVPWARIERAAYPLGDGFPDGIPIGNHMNIHHSWAGVALSFIYRRSCSCTEIVPKNIRYERRVAGSVPHLFTILQLKKIKSKNFQY